jgi:hypothetical protein
MQKYTSMLTVTLQDLRQQYTRCVKSYSSRLENVSLYSKLEYPFTILLQYKCTTYDLIFSF